MSIINQLLKDLDRQKNIDSSSYATVLKDLYPLPPSYSFFHKNCLAILLGTFALSIIMLFFTILFSSKNNHIHLNLHIPTAKNYSEVNATRPEEPAVIVDWQAKELTDKTRIILKTNAATTTPLHYALTDKNQHQSLELNFYHFTSNPQLKPIEISNSMIPSIETKTGNDEVDFIFNFSKDSHIKTVKLEASPQHMWNLILEAGPALLSPLNAKLPDAETITSNADRLVEASIKLSRLTAQQRFDHAMDSANQGDIESAIEEMVELLKLHPEHLSARNQLVEWLIEHNQITEAERWLKDGLAKHPHHTGFVKAKSRILLEKNRIEEAFHTLQQAHPIMREDPDYYALLALLLQDLGHSQAAAKIYQQLLELSPDNSVWWLGLGINLEQSNRASEAISAYQQALQSKGLPTESKTYVTERLRELVG